MVTFNITILYIKNIFIYKQLNVASIDIQIWENYYETFEFECDSKRWNN